MLFSWLASVLAFGGLISLLVVNPHDFGKGFHRFNGALACLFLTAGVAGGMLHGVSGWCALLSSTLWVLFVHWGVLRPLRAWLCVPIVMTGWALLSGSSTAPRSPLLLTPNWAGPSMALSAGILMGSVSIAMLLGHWYLVIPGLPMSHLRRFTFFMAGCIGLRMASGMISLASSHSSPALEGASAWSVAGGMAGFYFWQRIGIGLLAPAILAWLVYRTIRIGSTQSATGLLYVMMIFVLVGEMISRYLYVSLGVPQ